MRIIECEQGTDSWKQARCGRVTGSRIADVMAKGKAGAPSVTRGNYLAEIVAEVLTGLPTADKYQSAAMRQGSEREPDARRIYAFMHDTSPIQVGFVVHSAIERAGASPDSLVGEDGLAEIKSPLVATHLDTLLGAPIDGRYVKQMQWQLACCDGRKWVDFISFCPELPPEMQVHVRRVARDDRAIAEMETEVRAFLRDVDSTVEKLRRLYLSEAKAA